MTIHSRIKQTFIQMAAKSENMSSVLLVHLMNSINILMDASQLRNCIIQTGSALVLCCKTEFSAQWRSVNEASQYVQ